MNYFHFGLIEEGLAHEDELDLAAKAPVNDWSVPHDIQDEE